MTKWIDVSGKTEEDAINAGLASLRLERDDVSVEIIERAKLGFLGLGAAPAVVRLFYDAVSEPEEKDAAPAYEETGADAVQDSSHEEVRAFVAGLLERMNIIADITVTEQDKGGIAINLSGPGMGAVIGRRGETLDAIQHIANYAHNRGAVKRARISIDAENYRKKREESLVALANKMAEKAVRYRRSMALEPMNSYERHVIHTALQDYPDVSTNSTGAEPRRRVVVSYVKKQDNSDGRIRSQEWS